MPLQHATIKSLDTHTPEVDIEVKVNPTELSVQRGARYAEVAVPGLDVPLQQFVHGEAQQLTVELFLDEEARPDLAGAGSKASTVNERLIQLRSLIKKREHTHAPPVVQLSWGHTEFVGVATSLQEKFTLFDEEGNVTRARVTVTLKAFQSYESPTSSPDKSKAHIIRDGDRLDLLALHEYGDAGRWRVIAEANAIERPSELTPGTVLIIPSLSV